MELKNGYMIGVGIVVLLLLIFVRKRTGSVYKEGKKFVGMCYLEEEAYFKRRLQMFKALRILTMFFCVLAMAVSFLLLARPYKQEVVDKESYNRDIILCMDISYSVDELNLQLVDNLKETVTRLQGERFGIMIFNSSSVMLSPLTDDYNYVISVLDELKKSIAYRCQEGEQEELEEDGWLYLSNYIVEGTLMGAEERGSSLIADGLATAVYNFPDLQEKRTRLVIFSTDNDVQGTTLLSLDEAADLCLENNVVVYGIGTSAMYENHIEEMKKAVLKTGGSFYLQEETGTVKNIVSEIEQKAKNLVKGTKEIRQVEMVEIPVILLVLSIFGLFVCIKFTKMG